MDEQAVEIEAARKRDLPAVRTLAETVWRAHYPGIIEPAQIEYMLARMYSDEALRTFLFSPGAGLVLARVRGEAVGFAAWYRPDEPATVKLDKLYVLPERHGQGVGRALIAHVEAAARTGGCASLVLNVNKRNAKAIAAYTRAGFATKSSVVVDIGEGFVMDDYVMAKPIADR